MREGLEPMSSARPTKEETARHRAWLSEWRKPADMASYIDDIGGVSYGPRDGFRRDAWAAAKFGQRRYCSFVRLAPERESWPDFQARYDDGQEEQVECVEADVLGRRRHDECRRAEERRAIGLPTFEDDPEENWIERADQVPAALAAAVTKKIRKRYSNQASSLLVYLNISEFEIGRAKIEAAIEPAVAPALRHFKRVWVLWKSRLYGPWETR